MTLFQLHTDRFYYETQKKSFFLQQISEINVLKASILTVH